MTPETHGPSSGSISPDRRRLAMQRTANGNTDIWLLDLERGPSVRFTSEPLAGHRPGMVASGRPNRRVSEYGFQRMVACRRGGAPMERSCST